MPRACFVAVVAAAALGGLAVPARAQQSANYAVTEYTLNAAGRPVAGAIAQSGSFRLRLEAVGGSVRAASASSATHRLDAGFVAFVPAPGEVGGVRWTSSTGLAWDVERSAGSYEVHRDAPAVLPGSSGACWASGLPATNVTDASRPPGGGAFFYLVNVKSRLGERGTLGRRSDGSARPPGGACP